MKLNKLTERLFIYLALLDIYETSLKTKIHHDTDLGFCMCIAFQLRMKSVINNDYFKTALPELHRQKPKEMYDAYIGYWFKRGDLEPRIKALKDAIKLTEEKICLLEK